VFRVRYRYYFILLLAVYSYLNILYTIGTSLFDFEISQPHLFGVLALVVFGIWELNRLADILIERKQLAIRLRIHPLILLFGLSLIAVCISAFASIELLYISIGKRPEVNTNHLKLLLAFGFRVNLFLACVNAIVYYMDRLKKTQVEAEQLKKISAEAQFEALRAQINPHFLFNCFNVLSSLVYKDADTSARFIGQLSNVYRYLLYNQQKKLVPLSEELTFLESYLFLIKIRFGENIAIINETPEQQDACVPPAVLQMLIENAIKHNVVSRKNPLTIQIDISENYIRVINNLQKKEVAEEESTRTGLHNIRERYKFLSNQEVRIEETDKEFIVQLPIIKISES